MRRVALEEAAVLQHGHAVGHHQRLLLVVGDHDEGDADLVLQALQLELHGAAELFVERGERLVEQEHARPLDQSARQRHALLLAAGELLGAAAGELGQMRGAQDRVDALGDLGPGEPLHLQPVGDVAAHAHVREEGVGLEHQVERPPVRRDRRDVDAVEQDAARVRRLEAGEQAQERGLAAAGRAEEGEELVLADVERHGLDGGRAPETLRDAVDGEQRARRGHGAIVPRLRRCERASAVTLTAITMVASALISGVTPKRIIA